jgi:hypothetical protein
MLIDGKPFTGFNSTLKLMYKEGYQGQINAKGQRHGLGRMVSSLNMFKLEPIIYEG